MISSKIVGVGTYLTQPVTIEEIEKRIIHESGTKRLPTKIISKLTGVEQVYHRKPYENASDLAIEAARKALTDANLTVQDIDLLIFASASQDLIEPATAHIVSNNLDTTCPVFDVKNACNSFVVGIQTADAFIKQGLYKTILICTGETPSMAARWNCETREQFTQTFPGFSMSDTGGAIILQKVEQDQPTGIISMEHTAHSNMWSIGTLGTGGSRHPRDIEATYFNMDGRKLFEAFRTIGCELLFDKMKNPDFSWSHYKHVGMHQVSAIYNKMLSKALLIPDYKLISTIHNHGNLASNSFPIQFEIARQNMIPGDRFAFIGLGGGISTTFLIVEV